MNYEQLAENLIDKATEYSFGNEIGREPGFKLKLRHRKDDPAKSLWAISRQGQVMSKEGKWEYEPMPSSRSDAFKKRTRFTLLEAFGVAREHGLL